MSQELKSSGGDSSLCEKMVEEQIIRRGIRDVRLLKVLRETPRAPFLPDSLAPRAYEDEPLPIGFGQTLSQPYITARMTELLELKGGEKALEVGTGSGYHTAILAKLSRRVVSFELIHELFVQAKINLETQGVENIALLEGDGKEGMKEESPFEAILISAYAREIPQALLEQLAAAGRLVAPVGDSHLQKLVRARKGEAGEISFESFDLCRFVPLI